MQARDLVSRQGSNLRPGRKVPSMAGNTHGAKRDVGEEQILVLQGGGALGAYQAGVYTALSTLGVLPEWVAGISIGAINAALIAGNRPEDRAARLTTFWERVTSAHMLFAPLLWPLGRSAMNEVAASNAILAGVAGFFRPQVPPAHLRLPHSEGARGYYDTSPLRETLLELVDFAYLNTKGPRLSVGAVNVESGNMTWFDSAEIEIGPEHIMASGALPPGFPPVEIGGEFYWDGGLVSNTPLQYVLFEAATGKDKCVFQVDLFKARGDLPGSVWDLDGRIKDIRFSSRTRLNTDLMHALYDQASAARRLFDKLPAELRDDPDAKSLVGRQFSARLTVVHLIYRQSRHEHQSKDHEFSRLSMREHWQAGQSDVEETWAHADWQTRDNNPGPVKVFDLTSSGRTSQALSDADRTDAARTRTARTGGAE